MKIVWRTRLVTPALGLATLLLLAACPSGSASPAGSTAVELKVAWEPGDRFAVIRYSFNQGRITRFDYQPSSWNNIIDYHNETIDLSGSVPDDPGADQRPYELMECWIYVGGLLLSKDSHNRLTNTHGLSCHYRPPKLSPAPVVAAPSSPYHLSSAIRRRHRPHARRP